MNDDFDPAAGAEPLQQLHHSPATARVPEAVGHGVFATGVIILTNPHEVVLDFVQGISNPRRVAARVVLAHAVAAQFAAALEGNIARYTANFGPPRMPAPPQPGPPPAKQVVIPPTVAPATRPPATEESGGEPPADPRSDPPPTPAAAAAAQPISDIYDQIRLADDMVGGAYANVVAISHTPAEFCFDFIASVYPRSAVTARVYLAAPHAAEALASLRRSLAPRQPPG
jgi:hypothetical protein